MTDFAIISGVFQDVMGRTANFGSFEDRLEMQKIIYLIHELGVSCGDFSFRWYKHGPYSQQLQNVMIAGNVGEPEAFSFSQSGRKALDAVKHLISTPHDGYKDADWLEAIGSICYLQKHSYQTSNADSLLDELVSCKPHLNNKGLNRSALDSLHIYGI